MSDRPDEELPDEELSAAARGGDRAAYAALYDRYGTAVFDLCLTILRHRALAAMATRETFLRSDEWLSPQQETGTVRAALFATARRAALRLVRTRARERSASCADVDAPVPAADPGWPTASAELRRSVRDAPGGMTPRDRAVLDLHVRKGLEGRELAEALGVGENQAWARVQRVRRRFAQALDTLLVARGRARCSGLRRRLAGWDGVFTPQVRRRVARHVARCGTCTRAQGTSPVELLARLPRSPAPDALREQILERERPGGGPRDAPAREAVDSSARDTEDALLAATLVGGFRPVPAPPRRRWRVAAPVAAGTAVTAALLVWGAVAWGPLGGGSGAPAPPATRAAGPATGDPSTSPDGQEQQYGQGRATSGADGALPGRRGDPGQQRGTTEPATPDSPGTPTAPPVDTGEVAAEPEEVAERGSYCTTDREATITVELTSERALSSVQLHWEVGTANGATSMESTDSGQRYQAEVGAFDRDTIEEDTTVPVVLTVEVDTQDGDQARLDLPTETLSLRSCPLW